MDISDLSQPIDSLTIVPESIILINAKTRDTLPKNLYSIQNNSLILEASQKNQIAKFLIQYRVLPYDLSAPQTNLDTTNIQKDKSNRIVGITYDPFKEEESFLEFQKGLDYSGSFARGLSFGNSQNLVLNSSFNLQMAGNLGDGMEVLAAITDNNIPLQPEGNTQQLSEFDKIFIQITKDDNKLIAGDYELRRPTGYFMNYFKKLQGGTYSRQWNFSEGKKNPLTNNERQRTPIGANRQAQNRQPRTLHPAPHTPHPAPRTPHPAPRTPHPQPTTHNRQPRTHNRQPTTHNPQLTTQASVAVARGKFARNEIQAQEGNQGPYRLEGAEGERFIIILAGTEKVWVDGVVMKRGLEEDYIIDYNAGHVSFTQRRLITKDIRIIVEFEYADQNYLRSMYAVNLKYQHRDKTKLWFNVFSEQDGKKPVDNEFSPAEFEALQNSGDDPLNSVVSSIAKVEDASPFRVLYKLVDTLGFDSVLVFSNNEELTLHTAFFSFVGVGNGDYVLDPTVAANGRVYRWVAPEIQGLEVVHFGDYAPVRQLVSPKQQQLYTLGGEYQISKNTKVMAEVAMSNFDLNRLSNIQDNDNLGLATFSSFENRLDLGKKQDWQLKMEINHEFVQERFRALNPYRNAEFRRDWNIQSNERVSEHIGRGGFELSSKTKGRLAYTFSGFLRDSIYEGTKHLAQYQFDKKGFNIFLESNLLNSNSLTEASRFFRPKINFGIPFLRDSTRTKYWETGIYGERERNERFSKKNELVSDSLSSNSFWYDLFRVYLKSRESQKINFQVNYQRRIDYAPLNTSFEQATIANDLNLNGNWTTRWTSGKEKRRNNSRIGWNFTYRQLEIKNDDLTNEERSETFLGRLNYSLQLVNGVIQSNTSYEIGSGQERKSEFVFLPVQPGEGNYVWRNDDNGDGLIQQNEVEVAPFQDSANVLRQVVFTDEFIRTNNILFNQSLRIEPRAIWFGAKGLKKLLSRFSPSSSLQITRKVKDADKVSPWNPFQLDIIDTSLVATRSGIRNVLVFNANNPKFNSEIGFTDNQDKVVLTTGFESRRREERFFKTRWNIAKTFSSEIEFKAGRKIQDSEQFDNKDFNIRFFNLQPEFTWLPVKTFRTIVKYKFEDSKNTLENAEEAANTHELKLEMRYNKTSKISVQSSFSFVKISFNGEANSPVGFAFLNGLQNGQNYLWDVSIDRQLARNMRLSLSYEGRKTGKGRVVHVGRASVAATF